MNAPMLDPVKLSRMIMLLNDYVREGLIAKPTRAFTTMTHGELEELLEVGRIRRGEQDSPTLKEEPEPEAAPEEVPAQLLEPKELKLGPEGAAMPEGEEGAKISEQDFKDMFPVGTHIDYNGAEYVVIEHSKPGVEGGPSFEAVELSDTVTFSQVEFEEAEFEIHQEPTKIPQKTEYPPQVFLVAWEDGEPRAAIYKDLGALKGVHPRIDGDTIMEAISDPGTWQENGDFAVVFTSIG